GMLGANGIVGGGMPLPCGGGLAAQLRGAGELAARLFRVGPTRGGRGPVGAQVEGAGSGAACFFGDGAPGGGEFHESLNIASLWKLPLVFVCENNQYGAGNAVESVRAAADISLHAPAYGMPGVSVDGNDVLAVRAAMREAVERARRGEGPTLLHCQTF